MQIIREILDSSDSITSTNSSTATDINDNNSLSTSMEPDANDGPDMTTVTVSVELAV